MIARTVRANSGARVVVLCRARPSAPRRLSGKLSIRYRECGE